MLCRLLLLALVLSSCATVAEEDADFATVEGALTEALPLTFGQSTSSSLKAKSSPWVWTFQAGSAGSMHFVVKAIKVTTQLSVTLTRQSGKGWATVSKAAGKGIVQFDTKATSGANLYRLTVTSAKAQETVQVTLTCGSATCAPPPSTCDATLAAKLQPVLKGLLYLSESDYPFEMVSFASKTTGKPTPAELLAHLKLPANTAVEVRTSSQWFAPLLTLADPLGDAAKYAEMKKLLDAGLTDVTVIRVGKIQIGVYVIGRTKCGTISGVKTVAVET